MKTTNLLFILLIGLTFGACQNAEQEGDREQIVESLEQRIDGEKHYGLVIHGGAGTITRENMTPDMEKEFRAKLQEALDAGYAVLESGGTSLDAIQASIEIMEDSHLFNAGKGSVFNHDGFHEMDASIMSGVDRDAGAVAGVATIKNPIQAARMVMEQSEHVMLSGKGAVKFATDLGIETRDSSYFSTERRRQSLEKALQQEAEAMAGLEVDNLPLDYKFGTVGACALDQHGNLAAGTSTGGMTNKKWGRIGDSPVIGAGTYAHNATCAISCTGWGEYYIRTGAAKTVSDRMEYGGDHLADALNKTVYEDIEKLGGDGGIIGIDKNGKISWSFNTEGMYRGAKSSNGREEIHFYEDPTE